ncbi:hydrogenase nickel incorporation protein HypB [Bradyrhizobium sp. WSM1253]|uniref:hydrogenase nickel incorporation protein HypB n=1 Tax=Bradyrhizobium sp. WSM1253 TaxID=319003 RepID=UPI00025D15EE|nr:hydrogenase nickel incorporation protein HypB [Bradyrhizobium sp. WSM1253]EIG57897.1 hydrogenase accessory protein HypB [Bradyrhizobium sp. WSM1253]
MCGHCGCGDKRGATVLNLQTGKEINMSGHSHHDDQSHDHAHHLKHDHLLGDGLMHSHDHHHPHDGPHDHHHGHDHVHADGTRHSHSHAAHDDHSVEHRHDHAAGSLIELETRILARNDALAANNRAWFAGREILALNLVSSPGSGKTTLLEHTIRDLSAELKIYVVEGDQATANDGERIRAAGAPAVQVNTGAGCHLEADMVARGLGELQPVAGSVVMIENVGNLVCPSMFDLGERAKVVILSVTEGEDKPLKYPHMFRAAEIMILNKIDLLPHVDFDVSQAVTNARTVNPDITVFQLSARTGEGLADWYGWLRRELSKAGEAVFA